MSGVRDLARVPRLPQLFLWSMLGRLNVSLLPVGLSLMLVRWNGSYGIVGVVGGALTLGQAVAGPLRGRAADRGSTRRLLVITGIAYAIGLAVIVTLVATLPAGGWPVVVAVAVVTGLTAVPVSQISRATWPRVVGPELTRTLYTAEATASEVITTTGPLLAALIIGVAGPAWAVLVTALVALLSALLFAAALGRAGLGAERLPSRTESAAQRSLLTERRFVQVVVISMLVMAAIFTVNLSVVAWTQNIGRPALSGVLIAGWTGGSLAGGIAVSTFARRVPRAPRVAGLTIGMAVLAVLLPPVVTTSPIGVIAVVLFLGGTAIAPTLAANFEEVAESAPRERRAEAFGWLATASTGGAASSLPLAGVLIDRSGPAAAVAAGAALVLVALVLTLLSPRPQVPQNDRVEGANA
ncbi:MFS transporter [Paractinoplanes ferrugineus]|uniref:MFS transporter n=1 Tax=Paractinoplanes ferrugineus TaxID=113564 RepID=A0A919J2J9_9ACTN|nr:MFS transporter [Actinoplanes ferrugineus]GIE12758.1 MFS transporter [Actinoplanes ferrugineus]